MATNVVTGHALSGTMVSTLRNILGNQLFPLDRLPAPAMVPRMLDRVATDRLERIVALADEFIERQTVGS